jgi:hypothetical protein
MSELSNYLLNQLTIEEEKIENLKAFELGSLIQNLPNCLELSENGEF